MRFLLSILVKVHNTHFHQTLNLKLPLSPHPFLSQLCFLTQKRQHISHSRLGPYDRTELSPAVPLLSIYTKELKAGSQRHIRTPMFTAALITLAKGVNNPNVHLQIKGYIKRDKYLQL